MRHALQVTWGMPAPRHSGQSAELSGVQTLESWSTGDNGNHFCVGLRIAKISPASKLGYVNVTHVCTLTLPSIYSHNNIITHNVWLSGIWSKTHEEGSLGLLIESLRGRLVYWTPLLFSACKKQLCKLTTDLQIPISLLTNTVQTLDKHWERLWPQRFMSPPPDDNLQSLIKLRK